MGQAAWQHHLTSEKATAALAARFADVVEPGDTILLSGDIGAGKTHFARHVIQSLLTAPEDVPSPTFTLVQTYETSKGTVHHADLYRLTHADEVLELGLIDAFEHDICLLEWPDRLGSDAPEDSIRIDFAPGATDHARMIRVTCADKDQERMAKVLHD